MAALLESNVCILICVAVSGTVTDLMKTCLRGPDQKNPLFKGLEEWCELDFD